MHGKNKLDTLRKRYAEASMFDIHDPSTNTAQLGAQLMFESCA